MYRDVFFKFLDGGFVDVFADNGVGIHNFFFFLQISYDSFITVLDAKCVYFSALDVIIKIRKPLKYLKLFYTF